MSFNKHDKIKGKDEWLTPPYIFKPLQPFDLDVCQPINPPWKIASRGFNELDDGLRKDWHGFVWCNPPYGKETIKWVQRMNTHRNGIALIFARTDTKMFHDFCFSADAILFIRGRVSFCDVNGIKQGSSGAPSCLLGWGEEAVKRLENCGIEGKLIKNENISSL